MSYTEQAKERLKRQNEEKIIDAIFKRMVKREELSNGIQHSQAHIAKIDEEIAKLEKGEMLSNQYGEYYV